eukprot:309301_1
MMSTSITNWLQNNHYPSSFRTILLQNKIFITSDFGKLFWTQLFAIINEFKFEHSLQRTRFESDILALYFEFDYPEKYKQSLAKHKQQSSQIKMHYHEEPMKQTNHHIHLPQGMIASHYKRDSFGSLLNLNIEDLSSEEDSVQSSESSVSWPSGVDYDQYKPYKPYKGSTKLHNITMKYVSIYKCVIKEYLSLNEVNTITKTTELDTESVHYIEIEIANIVRVTSPYFVEDQRLIAEYNAYKRVFDYIVSNQCVQRRMDAILTAYQCNAPLFTPCAKNKWFWELFKGIQDCLDLMSTNVSREEFLDCVEMFGLNKALENLQLNSEISPEMNDMKCQSLL